MPNLIKMSYIQFAKIHEFMLYLIQNMCLHLSDIETNFENTKTTAAPSVQTFYALETNANASTNKKFNDTKIVDN